MEHKIKVKIADRCYNYTIHSELEEEAIRKAAQSVNEKISVLSAQYGGRPMIDILTIVALNEGIEKCEALLKNETDEKGMEKLAADLQNYVDSLK